VLTADAGAAARAGLPCTPKIATTNGKPSIVLCGPATVSLKVNGKTYSYSKGFCSASGSTFELSLGSLFSADHAHNAGKPYFSLTSVGKTADLIAQYGGKDLIGSGMTLAKVTSSGKNTGSFTGGLGGPKISGSWNCHGVIVKT
jgi:hypothetical protein